MTQECADAACSLRPIPQTAELDHLHQRYRQTDSADIRSRCQMVLLSAQQRAVSEIAACTFLGEDTVLYWIDRYERTGVAGLEDRPRSGRPPKS
jgi:transposase